MSGRNAAPKRRARSRSRSPIRMAADSTMEIDEGQSSSGTRSHANSSGEGSVGNVGSGGSPSRSRLTKIPKTIHNGVVTTQTLKQTLFLSTKGYPIKYMYTERFPNTTTDDKNRFSVFFPGLARLPVDCALFYAPANMWYHYTGADLCVDHVKVKCTPWGITYSRPINTTDITNMNGEQEFRGKYVVGLNHVFDLLHGRPIDLSSKMDVSDIEPMDAGETFRKMYGVNFTNENVTPLENPTDVPAIMGAIKDVGIYTAIPVPLPGSKYYSPDMSFNAPGTLTNTFDRPILSKYFTYFHWRDNERSDPIVTYEYAPRDGRMMRKLHRLAPLHDPEAASGNIVAQSNNMLHNVVVGDQKKGNFVSSASHPSGVTKFGQRPLYIQPVDMGSLYIENAGINMDLAHGPHSLITQPELHIGLDPVVSMTPSGVPDKAESVVATWQIETEITFTVDNSTRDARPDYLTHSNKDSMVFANKSIMSSGHSVSTVLYNWDSPDKFFPLTDTRT